MIMQGAAGLALAGILAAGSGTAAHAQARPQASYRLWRDVVREPGTLCLTFTSPHVVHDVQAVAVYAAGGPVDLVQSRVIPQAGTVYTLCLDFPHGTKTGTWDLAGVYAAPAGRSPGLYAQPAAGAVTPFEVRS